MKNFLVRTASGAVMLIVVLGAILLSKWSFAALMALIAVGGMWEFYRFAEKAGYQPMKWLGLFAGAMIICLGLAASMFFDKSNEHIGLMLTVASIGALILIMPLMFICELYRKSQTPIANVATSVLGALFVALPMALLLVVPMLIGMGEWNPWIMIFYIFIIYYIILIFIKVA